MTKFSSLRSVIASTMILCLASQTVWAAPPSGDPPSNEADSHANVAIEAFGAGHYDEAIAEFEAAFALDQNPNHLFNIGRVHEEVGNLEAAVDYYKRFIAQPGVQIDYRAAALERIDVLERSLATQKQPESEPEPEPEVEPHPNIAAPQPIDQVDEPATDSRKGQRNAGWALLGIGGAALIAGAVTTGLTASTSNRLADESDPAEREQLVARGQMLAPTSDALLVAGGTLALVGLIVALTALPKRGDRRTASLPYAGAGGGGIVVIHRF